MAHYIYHLLSDEKVSLEDDVSQLDLKKADHQKDAEMIEKNVLGFYPVKIYSLKMRVGEFIFVFARSTQEAKEFYVKTFQCTPLNCYEYSLEFEISRGKGSTTFREMKKEFVEFPTVAGIFKR
ncbi:hypothetical protein [Litchfieldia alkalitelluris]|uniref:hypothetical protein n=1 Tax=Litchfieldia alkalitelluris TaxID=304268 RepID=UPI001F3F0BF0|nr:hypothetical protein [Litchfieldia alkalitelluris]